eukprot:TRINITY_DN14498_c0_g1_i1.p1 TRINITY_DN14498_c0_g1~~TRINITY_DN14498_c0_g1_i1.p1  ORF type:complete len:448 (+),score=85.36 TRINITY_DN14498_c0_g1_i1:37-1380(+)
MSGREYRRKCPVHIQALIELAQHGRFMVVASTGPTSYVIKLEGDEKKYKVMVGNPHKCSCRASGDLCLHVLFILLRVFKVPEESEVCWQKGLTDRQIQSLLDGSITMQRRAVVQKPKGKRSSVTRQPLEEADECPICYDTLSHSTDIVWCRKGCGNNIHTACMKEWSLHSGSGPITCPYCRSDWGTIRDVKPKKDTPKEVPKSHEASCKQCADGVPIVGPLFTCTHCISFTLCSRCVADPLVHPNHGFVVAAVPGGQRRHVDRSRLTNNNIGLARAGVVGTGLQGGRALLSARKMSEGKPKTPHAEESVSLDEENVCLQVSSRRIEPPPASAPALAPAPQASQPLLTQDSVNMLPMTQWTGGPGACGVCHEAFEYLDTLRTLPCTHTLHTHCSTWWLTNNSSHCPTCSTPVLQQPRHVSFEPLRAKTSATHHTFPYRRPSAARRYYR